MEILNLQQIIWQAVNFLILYLVIAKFVVPPTQKYLKKRESAIKEGLENADKVKMQLAEAEKLKEEIISAARAEGQKILEEVKVKSEELSIKLHEEAKEGARKAAQILREQAISDIEKRKQELNEESIRIASLIAKKSLSGAIDVELQHELLRKQLEELKKADVPLH